ncbi:MAG TPA: TetR family transcriptional regulator [Dongiaceae bacterium]|jgi:TetR/AcrR family transcriptional regulator|nr:TetR family transcriptional regulator [Dongiaceae bacterium]
MKTSGSRSQRSAETKASILAVAERSFATAGLAGARMEAIAAAAGVNKALLYYYFKDKQALYEAIVEDHFRTFNARALELLGRPGPAGAVLLEYVSLHFDFISAKQQSAPLFQQFMMSHAPRAKKLIRKYVQPRSAAMAALLERGMRSGEFRRTDPFHTAVSIVALIVFYFSAAPVLQLLGHTDAHSPASLKRRKREVQDFIRHALFVHPHPVVL